MKCINKEQYSPVQEQLQGVRLPLGVGNSDRCNHSTHVSLLRGTSIAWINLWVDSSLMVISSEHYTIQGQLTGSKESLRIFLDHIDLYTILFWQQLLIGVSHLRDNYLPSARLFPNPFLLKDNCLLNTPQYALPAFESLHSLSPWVLSV